MSNTPKRRARKTDFPHHKLVVYKEASDFFVKCWKFAERNRFPEFFIRSQFLRQAYSIKLNIAEGAMEIRKLEKARFYRIARRSCGECACTIDDFPMILGVSEEELQEFYDDLLKLSNTLRQLALSMERAARSERRAKPKKAQQPSSPVAQ